MKTLWLVIEREFLTRVRKRGYWVFTVLGLLMMVALVFLPVIMRWIENKSMDTVAVHDPHHIVIQALQQAQAKNPEAIGVKFISAQDSGLDANSPDSVKAYLKKQDAKALIDVRGTSPADASFVVKQVGSLDPSALNTIETLLTNQVMQGRIQQLDAAAQGLLSRPVPIDVQSLEPNGKSMDELIQAKMLVYMMEILLMITLILYGTWVAQGIIEEKSNRIVEMLLVAAKPWQILFGKVIGVGLVGLVQYAIWLSGILVAMAVHRSKGPVDISAVPLSTLVWFPVFFILGYLLYATLFGIGGSLVYRAEEQQMAITPVSLLMVVAFYTALGVFINADSTFATVVSLVPFCAPLAMFARIAMTHVPAWQVAASLLLLLAFIFAAVRIGERVYRRYALRTSGASGWKLLFRNRAGSLAQNQ
jgi:ABC-2 type transport system permease protein